MDAHSEYPDVAEDRPGEWMHTHSGKRFFPLDPRPEDICIDDIANGLALDCRYAGQGRVDRFYSVAEHSVHIARFARAELNWSHEACLAALMHDAPEGFINDLNRATKSAVGEGYKSIEKNIGDVIARKYGYYASINAYHGSIKELDRRIVPTEKAAIMAVHQDWAHDQFEPLPAVVICCWPPALAKGQFLNMFNQFYKGDEE